MLRKDEFFILYISLDIIKIINKKSIIPANRTSSISFESLHKITEHHRLKIIFIIKFFIYPNNAQLDYSKRMLKFTLIFTLKMLLHVSV